MLNHNNKRFNVEEIDIKKISIRCLRCNDLTAKYSINSIQKILSDVEGN